MVCSVTACRTTLLRQNLTLRPAVPWRTLSQWLLSVSLFPEPAILSLTEFVSPELSYSSSSTLEVNKQHKYKTTAYSTTALYLPYSLSVSH